MNVLTRTRVLPTDAAYPRWPALEENPFAYGLLRQILLSGANIEEREAQRMDRAARRLLDS
jgi:hypothetical protein